MRTQPKPFLDATRRDWQFAAFAWLLRHTGGIAKFADTTLVLPTPEHFPASGMQGQAGVSALFRRVRDHAGMADWPCSVEAESAVEAGRHRGLPVLRYSEGHEPDALVATFARELARLLVETFDEPPPGGAPLHEPAIDVAAVFMGFGVFLANSAIAGPRYELNEGELAHALAMFCLLRELDPRSIDAHLNPHLRKHVRLATRDLARQREAFRRLRAEVPALSADRALSG